MQTPGDAPKSDQFTIKIVVFVCHSLTAWTTDQDNTLKTPVRINWVIDCVVMQLLLCRFEHHRIAAAAA